MTPPPFPGFRPAALTFFRGLNRNNSKTWFEANRHVYETLKQLVTAPTFRRMFGALDDTAMLPFVRWLNTALGLRPQSRR